MKMKKKQKKQILKENKKNILSISIKIIFNYFCVIIIKLITKEIFSSTCHLAKMFSPFAPRQGLDMIIARQALSVCSGFNMKIACSNMVDSTIFIFPFPVEIVNL